MKHLTILLIVCFINLSGLYAQNLVPNPSFEEYIKQPCGFVDPPRYITEYIKDWYVPTGCTTDYWHGDSTIQLFCPSLLPSYKLIPKEGKFCLAMFTTHPTSRTKNYREYIQVKLNNQLTVGKVYYLEMYALISAKISLYTSNNIGMLLTTDSLVRKELFPDIGHPILASPQVNQTQVITELEKWKRVSGCVVADKPYRFLTLGNFFNDDQTKRIIISGPSNVGSYFFIDAISITEADTPVFPSAANFGRDTTLCPGQTIALQTPTQPGVSYRWQDGRQQTQYEVKQSGLYSVTATAGKCAVTDSVRVTIEPALRLPADTVLCQGEELRLAPRHPFGPLRWSDGSTDSTLTVSQAGIYWAEAPSRVCVLRDSIRVETLDCPGEIPNVITPNGDGRNDQFVIRNIQNRAWQLTIINRWGNRVYESQAYQNDWDGGNLPPALYYYLLYNDTLKRSYKGWVQIYK